MKTWSFGLLILTLMLGMVVFLGFTMCDTPLDEETINPYDYVEQTQSSSQSIPTTTSSSSSSFWGYSTSSSSSSSTSTESSSSTESSESTTTSAPADPVTDITYLELGKFQSDRNVLLSWTNPHTTLLSSIEIYYSTTEIPTESTGILLDSVEPPASYVLHSSLTPQVTYYYTVYAVDVGGTRTPGVSKSIFIRDTDPPGMVSNLTASNIQQNEITLSWDNPTDGDFGGVLIRYSDTEYPQTIYEGTELTSTTDSAYIHSVPSFSVAYYAIFAFDDLSTIGLAPNYSEPVFLRVETDVPEVESPMLYELKDRLVITWKRPVSTTDLVSYRLVYSTTEDPTNPTDGTILIDEIPMFYNTVPVDHGYEYLYIHEDLEAAPQHYYHIFAGYKRDDDLNFGMDAGDQGVSLSGTPNSSLGVLLDESFETLPIEPNPSGKTWEADNNGGTADHFWVPVFDPQNSNSGSYFAFPYTQASINHYQIPQNMDADLYRSTGSQIDLTSYGEGYLTLWFKNYEYDGSNDFIITLVGTGDVFYSNAVECLEYTPVFLNLCASGCPVSPMDLRFTYTSGTMGGSERNGGLFLDDIRIEGG